MVKACCVYGDGWHFVMGSLCAAFHWGALNTYRGLALLLLSWERMGPFIFQIFIWRAHVLEAEMDMIKKNVRQLYMVHRGCLVKFVDVLFQYSYKTSASAL